jgi:bacterioferritin-associated ferredoxin
MQFLKKWFKSAETPADNGIYLNVECGKCSRHLRLRINPGYDLENTGNGFVWHKTIVCDKCFRQMPTVVQFDRHHTITHSDITNGRYLP